VKLVPYVLLTFLFLSNKVVARPYEQPQPPEPHCEYAVIDVLIVIYSNTAAREIAADDIQKIMKVSELSREFIWRNSECRLNLNLSYLEITDVKPMSFYPATGIISSHVVEMDLIHHGVAVDQYGIIVLFYSPPLGGIDSGGMTILGNSGYAMIRYPFRAQAPYPVDDPAIDVNGIWQWTSTVLQSVDIVCYEKSGYPGMWHVHQPLDFAVHAGDHFSYLAESLRQFKDYFHLKSPWGSIARTVDSDGDLFPDNDSLLAMDEQRFGSDATKRDSDADGLFDLAEFTAGIYAGSDPTAPDSDEDGSTDSQDDYPLCSAIPEIPKMTPDFNGGFHDWFLISDEMAFSTPDFTGSAPLSAKVYLCWDDEFLYIATETNAPAEMHLNLDLNDDGWWHGKDNYHFVIDPFTSRFVEVRVLDTTYEARALSQKFERGFQEMWDDDPNYTARFGRLIDEFSLKLTTQSTETKFIIKVAIPDNKLVGFQKNAGKQSGIRIYYYPIYSSSENQWASVFEPYSFFRIVLK